jgi:hypothetical protein
MRSAGHLSAVNLTKLLFEPTLVRSPMRVVQWWESRRLTYNAIVGGTGLFTLSYFAAIERLFFDAGPLQPTQILIATVAYGIAANVCYTGGWIVENLVERWLKRPVYGLGPALFRHGLVFSIGLTLIPAVVATIAAIGGLLFGGP